jgi:hypothetical protein
VKFVLDIWVRIKLACGCAGLLDPEFVAMFTVAPFLSKVPVD